MKRIQFTYTNETIKVPQYQGGDRLIRGGAVWDITVDDRKIQRVGRLSSDRYETFEASIPDDRAKRILEVHRQRWEKPRTIGCDSHALTYYAMGWLGRISAMHTTKEPLLSYTENPKNLAPGEPYGIFKGDKHLYSVIGLGEGFSLSSPGNLYNPCIIGNGILLAATGGDRFALIGK